MKSMKSLQAQHRSNQKKTSSGLCPNFIAFRNQGAAESHTLSHFSPEDSLRDVIYCSRTVFREGKTSSGIFQFSVYRLKGTMRYIAKKAVQVKAEACFWGGYETIMLQNQGYVFCSRFQTQPGSGRKFATPRVKC